MIQPLRPSLHEKFTAAIWKIETDEVQKIIVTEIRDALSRTVTYSAFNYETGVCYFRGKGIENGWWFGLDKVCGGVIFLFGYPSENSSNPGRKGIVALDLQTGEILWQQFNKVLERVSGKGILVSDTSFSPKKLEMLAVRSGQKITVEPEYIIPHLHYPEIWDDHALLPSYLPDTTIEPVLYALLNEKHCWSFHTGNNGNYEQYLLIAQGDEVLLRDNLAKGIQKLNPEAFFIQQDYLFCIRNKAEIVTYLV